MIIIIILIIIVIHCQVLAYVMGGGWDMYNRIRGDRIRCHPPDIILPYRRTKLVANGPLKSIVSLQSPNETQVRRR